MALRIKKTYPSASYLSRHEASMLWLQLTLARIPQPIGRSKVFVSLPPQSSSTLSLVHQWQFFDFDIIKNHQSATVFPSAVSTIA
jgi:hypothetical protein